jgi:hypothetical protein
MKIKTSFVKDNRVMATLSRSWGLSLYGFYSSLRAYDGRLGPSDSVWIVPGTYEEIEAEDAIVTRIEAGRAQR